MSLDMTGGHVLEESDHSQVPPRKTRSLPRSLSREAVNPGGGVKSQTGEREARVAVMGEAGVGKTALVVRFITKRFIGDYAHYETTTSVTTMIDSKPTCLTILDTTGQDTWKRDQHLEWAEGIMLVFSVTDVDTFNALQSIIDQITTVSSGKRPPPIVIVGNKSDLCHVREVSESAGKKLAKRVCCPYRETSASDSYESVSDAFLCVVHEIQKAQRKLKKNGTSKIAQLKETLRSWTDFRMRTNTF